MAEAGEQSRGGLGQITLVAKAEHRAGAGQWRTERKQRLVMCHIDRVQPYRQLRCIVRCEQAGGSPHALCIVAHSQWPDDRLDRFNRCAAWPQQHGSGTGKIQHGRFHAQRTRPAVEHDGNATRQVIQDVLRRGRTYSAGKICRGCGNRPAGLLQQRERRVVRGDAYRQRIEPRTGQQAHFTIALTRQDQCQGAWPKCSSEARACALATTSASAASA